MNRVGDAILAGRDFLTGQQRQDGGFDGMASADKTRFNNYRIQPTIFFTALICQSCHEIPGTKTIRNAACAYLLHHKSSVWSWNYWQRDTPTKNKSVQSYPDDLDDTACAMMAIIQHDPTLLTGTVLGHLGRQLVASETAVGGPYQTWLVAPNLMPAWQDVDVAVNANIAGMLHLAQAMPAGLELFLEQAVVANKLTSSYYLGNIPTLYFMARSGTHSYTTALTKRITTQIQQTHLRSPLMIALLLAAGCRVGCPQSLLKPLAEQLVTSQEKGKWVAGALYIEPALEGVPYYAGSAALTTAFACEALSLYQRHQPRTTTQSKAVRGKPSKGLLLARHYSKELPQSIIRQQYGRAVRTIASCDTDGQISAVASHFARDTGLAVPSATLHQLDAASVHGWIAYTAYDDILDGDENVSQLGMANTAQRRCLYHFQQALGHNLAFTTFVAEVLDSVDEANSWEITHARQPVDNGILRIRRLPDYGNLDQLAQRSWGHILATTGVLLAAGYQIADPAITSWHAFLKHFLIARQLNDDAHDWFDDLSAGRMTVVVGMVLAEYRLPTKIALNQAIPKLRQHFWETTILQVCDLIDAHVQLAFTALATCTLLKDNQRYRQQLMALTTAANASREGRQEALDFMASFEPSV